MVSRAVRLDRVPLSMAQMYYNIAGCWLLGLLVGTNVFWFDDGMENEGFTLNYNMWTDCLFPFHVVSVKS